MNHSPEWHAARKNGIGGSEVAAILGLSNFATAYDIWESKTSDEAKHIDDNEQMRWGRILEPVIVTEYIKKTKNRVTFPPRLVHPDYPYMGVNLDGLANENIVVEAKNVRYGDEWGEEGTDQIPIIYNVQCQYNMMVASAYYGIHILSADVPVLIAGSDHRIYHVPADIEMQGMLADVVHEFWELVRTKTPPEPKSAKEINQRFKTSKAGRVIASKDDLRNLESCIRLKEDIAVLSERLEEKQGLVKYSMGEKDTLVYDGQTIATWRQGAQTKKFDKQLFMENEPDLYDEYCQEYAGNRNFLIKLKH